VRRGYGGLLIYLHRNHSIKISLKEYILDLNKLKGLLTPKVYSIGLVPGASFHTRRLEPASLEE
jgi:hypothetical protein